MEKIILPIEDIGKNFSEHLNGENNSRILFSGKFGMGKTYFLNKYFDEHEKDYDVYHLYPVNYQISQNDDIIDLLKYDILVELTNKYKNAFKENKIVNLEDISILTYLFGRNNISDILKTSVSYLHELGRPLKDTISLIEKFISFKNDLETGEKGIVKDYIKSIESKNIQENDYLSHLINDKISHLSEDKESILILDDLDRIEPEHIFRILNIFSAHFDINNNETLNKFGFDKIILVCDIENIKNIFHHKYGENTDFNGYIDKFYSLEPYHFDNDKVINSFIFDIITSYNRNKNNTQAYAESGWINIVLQEILKNLVLLKGKYKLELRQLLKGEKNPIQSFQKSPHAFSDNPQFILLSCALDGLLSIYGDKQLLVEAFSQINFGIKEDFLNTNEKTEIRYLAQLSYYIFFGLGLDKNEQPLFKDMDISISNTTLKLNKEDRKSYRRLFFELVKMYYKSTY